MNNSDVVQTPNADCNNERWALAVNPETPSHILDALLENGEARLLERVAEHQHASTAALTFLAQHNCPNVRAAVAENHNTPQQIVFDLAKDECLDVRYGIAENPHTPLVILDTLADDDNPYIAHRARATIRRVQFVPGGTSRLPVERQSESEQTRLEAFS